MLRCIELAHGGAGHVAPNPLVGCVIVRDDRIIGEGYHQQYGEAHAEVNAVNSVKNPSEIEGSTVYVNLEPCAHHGKTPPCADLLIEKKVKEVIIANRDPFAEVDGKGIEKLKAAGISVSVGINEKEGAWLNRRFFTFHQKKRPCVILKWAETADGFIDHQRKLGDGKSPLSITSTLSNRLVHKWRAEESAILVGKNTALLDNPRLNVRHWSGKNPIRIVIDQNGDIPHTNHLLSDGLSTLIIGQYEGDYAAVECIQLSSGKNLINDLMPALYKRDVQSIIIEGGANVHQQFIDANIWDEARVFSNEVRIGAGVRSPNIEGVVTETKHIGSDRLQILLPK